MAIRDNMRIHQTSLFQKTPKTKPLSGNEIADDNFGRPPYTLVKAMNDLINFNSENSQIKIPENIQDSAYNFRKLRLNPENAFKNKNTTKTT